VLLSRLLVSEQCGIPPWGQRVCVYMHVS
jgi:hypothetical protein